MTGPGARVVLVTRPTDYDSLLAAHATRGQAEFFLKHRGQSLGALERQKARLVETVGRAKAAIPDDWSVAEVQRDDLDRFLFAPNDIVIAIGQDGLVANLAKYVSGQPVIGVSPDPENAEGILTPLSVDVLADVLPRVLARDVEIQSRTMVELRLDDGQRLAALNELFIGHRSHQSARYDLELDGRRESQSSSGVIVSTGTGLTGWARSILGATHRRVILAPEDRRAVFLTREPWPSLTTGTELSFGEITDDTRLAVISHMNDGGVIFADGIERDYLRFNWGVRVEISLASRTLNLVRA